MLVQLPPNTRKQQVTPKVNNNKWYEFHRNYNHTMEDYTILRDKIEWLVRQELLDKYITRWRKSRSRDRDTRKR